MKRKIFNNKYILLLFCCGNLLIVSNKSMSQDFHLSQFDAFTQYLNPAMTGMFNGDYRINVQYRNQWASVLAKPFTTTGIGFDKPSQKFNNFKFGGYILNYRAGAGSYNVLNAMLSGAYDLAIKKSHNHIAMGAQAGVISKSVNMNNMYFESQYNTLNGGGFNTSSSSGELFNNTSIVMPDLNLGVLYYYSNTQSRINPFLGFSVFHLTQPKETFFDIANHLPRRYVAQGGFKINISERNQVNIHVLAEQQTNVREIAYNIMGMYYLRNNNVCLLYGFSYRSNHNVDADVISLGIKRGDFTYRVGYDVNISSLQTYSNKRGGFEMSLIYIHRRAIANPKVTCPRI